MDDTGLPKVIKERSEMMASVMCKLEPGVNTYSNFTYLGRFPVPPVPRVARCEAPITSFVNYIEDISWFESNMSDLVVAKNTVQTLDASVRKMDVLPTRDYLNCSLFPRVIDFVSKKFEQALTQTSMSIEQVFASMEMDKATGYVLRQNGYKKKHQVVSTGVWRSFLDLDLIQEIPIWLACGKEREYLFRNDYVVNKKQRTFIIEPFELLFQHKLIYGHQSEGMKNTWWSAYGLNPYEGGVNRMAKRLKGFKRFTMFDVIRYDRKFPHMRSVFEIKNTFAPWSPFRDWVTENCCKSRVVLPNGDFIEKDWGNNSGSGSTTVDNIIGMAICIVHFLLRLGVKEDEIDNYVDAFLFGDDVVMGDSIDIDDETFKEVLVETFRMYGFEFDPIVISHDLRDMEFLGFQFQEHEGNWIPKYNLGVLSFGFIHNHDTIDKLAEISKFGSIMLMSAGHGEFIYNRFRNNLINCLMNFDDERVKFLKINNFAGVPTFNETMRWYLGLESFMGDFYVFLSFTNSFTEVEGVQKKYEES